MKSVDGGCTCAGSSPLCIDRSGTLRCIRCTRCADLAAVRRPCRGDETPANIPLLTPRFVRHAIYLRDTVVPVYGWTEKPPAT
eukprot:2872957-Rhodomonas_salina.2